MSPDPQVTYATAYVGLRAPRVAIVFDGGDDWHYWARRALFDLTKVWGGAGFVLVPHRGGVVEPALLQLVRTYDPDYVAVHAKTWTQMETASPGQLRLVGTNGVVLQGEDRLKALADCGDWEAEDPIGHRARESVADVCASYRRWSRDVDRRDEHLLVFDGTRVDGPLTSLADAFPALDVPLSLGVPADWGGALAVATAMRCGVAADPELATDIPISDTQVLDQLVAYTIDPERNPAPLELVRFGGSTLPVRTDQLPTLLDATTSRLTSVAHGYTDRPRSLVVAGSEAADFALAMIWDRTFGNGIWLADAAELGAHTGSAAWRALHWMVGAAASGQGEVWVTSTSLDSEALQSIAAVLVRPVGEPADVALRAKRVSDLVDAVRVMPNIEAPTGGFRQHAIGDQYELPFTVPVRLAGGGVTMEVALPPVLPADPVFAQSRVLRWEFDVRFVEDMMPRSRGIDTTSLRHPGDAYPWDTWVRDAREGLSFHSGSQGFVVAGATAVARLARPRLRTLDLPSWVAAKLAVAGHTSRPSAAGGSAQVMANIWGGREAAAGSLASPLLPALREFQIGKKKSSDAYPSGDGIVLGTEGYLTLAGISARVMRDGDGLRDQIDGLLAIGALRRGLVLDCAACHRPRFVTVDDLGQRNHCPRCGGVSELIAERWNRDGPEPSWFYDLHPIVRDVLGQNNEVPFLASYQLRVGSRTFSDTPELDVFDHQGKLIAEVDVVAHADGQLIVGEAKSTDSLGAGKVGSAKAAKLVRVARLLGADQVLMATTAGSWAAASLDAVRASLNAETWPTSRRPGVQLMTGLGTDSVTTSRAM